MDDSSIDSTPVLSAADTLALDALLGAAVDYQLDGDVPALRRRLTTLGGLLQLRSLSARPTPEGLRAHLLAPNAPTSPTTNDERSSA